MYNAMASKEARLLDQILWCGSFHTHNTFKSAVMAKNQEDNLS